MQFRVLNDGTDELTNTHVIEGTSITTLHKVLLNLFCDGSQQAYEQMAREEGWLPQHAWPTKSFAIHAPEIEAALDPPRLPELEDFELDFKDMCILAQGYDPIADRIVSLTDRLTSAVGFTDDLLEDYAAEAGDYYSFTEFREMSDDEIFNDFESFIEESAIAALDCDS